jgi:anaerobic selenocysteine-containing dehydrogenase/Fe-S-cluster-containing dehydrogenase component
MSQQINRRNFLKILGVGGAATALVSCSVEPPEKLIPYLIPPEEIIPGVATWYATVCRECPAGCGILVRTREGRAVKVEGNPSHPVNRGRLCARGQASLQGLYNPDRIRQPLLRGDSGQFQSISWEEAERLLVERLADLRRQGKAKGIACVTPLLSGSLDHLIGTWLAALGSKRRLTYEAFAYEPLKAANRIAFGLDVIPSYDIGAAELLLSFGADFLETWISPVAYTSAFAATRAYRDGRVGTAIYVGPRLSLTAANTDQWVRIKPGTELYLVMGLIHVILKERLAPSLPQKEVEQLKALVKAYDPEAVAAVTEVPAGKVFRLARMFAGARPGLAIGGGVAAASRNATATLVAINLLNYVTGNVGRTVRFGPNANLAKLATYRDMLSLVKAMDKGEVQALLLYGVNPLFTLPEAAGFRAALKKTPFVVSFAPFMDETTTEANLILPDHTPLESWGDYSPWEGVHGLMQPVMQPVFNTKAVGDLLLSVAKRVDDRMAKEFPWPTFYEYARDRWGELHRRVAPMKEFEAFWEEALRSGGIWKEARATPVRLSPEAFQMAFEPPELDGGAAEAFHLLPFPSLVHYDGRGANRPWLQELPDPVTEIVWDSWLEIHPEAAKRMGIGDGDVIAVTSPHGALELPAHLHDGLHLDTVAIPIGQGHSAYGRYAEGRGANPLVLLSPDPEEVSGGLAWSATKVTLRKTGRRHHLVTVGGSSQQFGRGIAQALSLAEMMELAKDGEGAGREAHRPKQIYPPHDHPKHRWGMSIDLNACVGCNACVAACYAENNIPVVGKERVAEGRIMSWIRITRFVEAQQPNRPDIRFLPMLCQHCDAAPCESVCPVYATIHTSEGLNAQVYNRCVGVRYCSNNCPYKVRRFNWFPYTWPEPLNWQLNPDVTVRTVGIMEKCTFCVQRIRGAEDRAKDEGRAVREGEVTPACAQACPARAIVFGDLKDPRSEVSKLSRDSRRYQVLEELNTQPAVTYLKKIRQALE